MALGKFINAVQSEGNIITTGIPIALTADVFSQMPYHGFIYRHYKPTFSVINKSIKINELTTKYFVYSTKLNRTVLPLSFDATKKQLRLQQISPALPTHLLLPISVMYKGFRQTL